MVEFRPLEHETCYLEVVRANSIHPLASLQWHSGKISLVVQELYKTFDLEEITQIQKKMQEIDAELAIQRKTMLDI